jgi:hypothetical protein
MCVEVQIGSTRCDTVGTLRAALSGPILGCNGRAPDPDEYCLCRVDLDATAAANGMTCRPATEAEGYPFPDFILVPNAELSGGGTPSA